MEVRNDVPEMEDESITGKIYLYKQKIQKIKRFCDSTVIKKITGSHVSLTSRDY